jgi:hypothetical protein
MVASPPSRMRLHQTNPTALHLADHTQMLLAPSINLLARVLARARRACRRRSVVMWGLERRAARHLLAVAHAVITRLGRVSLG